MLLSLLHVSSLLVKADLVEDSESSNSKVEYAAMLEDLSLLS